VCRHGSGSSAAAIQGTGSIARARIRGERGGENGSSGICGMTRWPLHTSFLEGINNKIKVIKRMAYGFRDEEYFFLKIRAAFPGNPG
jgi:hypothetical protein